MTIYLIWYVAFTTFEKKRNNWVIVRIKVIAHFEQFLFFLQCFQKLSAVNVSNEVCLNLSHIQRICSRRLWKQTQKDLEIPFKWKYNNWIELKTSWQKEKLLVLSNFFFCRQVFKKPSAAEASESIYIRERVKEKD